MCVLNHDLLNTLPQVLVSKGCTVFYLPPQSVSKHSTTKNTVNPYDRAGTNKVLID